MDRLIYVTHLTLWESIFVDAFILFFIDHGFSFFIVPNSWMIRQISSIVACQTLVIAVFHFVTLLMLPLLFDQAGLALGDLKSVKDLYDFKTLSVLFLIGFVSILPTVLKRKRVYE